MHTKPETTPLFPVGVHFIFFSACGFALMSASVKWVSNYGIPVFEIVAARALVSLIISYLDVKRKKISVWGNNKKLLFARGAVGTLSLMCVYYAVTTIPLAEATILQYTYPVFTSILALIFLREPVRLSTFICITLSILGLVCMLQISDPTNSETLPLISLFAALLGALGSSFAYIIVRKLSNTEDSSVIIFYFPLVALPISLLLMGNGFVIPNFQLTIVLILVGIFTQIGQVGLTKAMKTLTASEASAYGYIQIIFSTLIGIVIFAEIPSTWTYIGALLIVSGALINLFAHKIPLLRR